MCSNKSYFIDIFHIHFEQHYGTWVLVILNQTVLFIFLNLWRYAAYVIVDEALSAR